MAAAADKNFCKPGPGATCVEHNKDVFGPDPTYDDKAYDAAGQKSVYGDKHLNKTQRPLLELGRPLYSDGPFTRSSDIFGETNLASPQFMIFGDVRTAIAANDNGDKEVGLWAVRANFDIDLKLTATERFHVFYNPLQKKGKSTGSEFFWNDDDQSFEFELEPEPEAYFFEGDVGAMWGGAVGEDSPFDLPIAGGLMPLLFQNGIWVEDAFYGAAFTIPARNSVALDISNMDITFFLGLDRVTNGKSFNSGRDSDEARIYGVTSFIEAAGGYFEAGYGYTEDRKGEGRGYHNMTVSYTGRYRNWVSSSIRVIGNFGQDPTQGVERSARGAMILLENSLITSMPSNLVPYLNVFFGIDRPQALARVNGLLKNTGIGFESDALTGFPFMNDAGADSVGGALGLELLGPNFEYQLVGEVAVTQEWDDQADEKRQIGFSIRTQFPLTNALILRIDGIYAIVADKEDIRGARTELRYKF